MPRKNRDEKNAYQREYYHRPENHRKAVDRVLAYKRQNLRGVCKNCGGPTQGIDKQHIPEWCKKPDCARKQRKALVAADPDYYRELGKKGQRALMSKRYPMLREFIEREVV